MADPRLRAGLDWGAPRSGHPEGRVAEHVAAMLAEGEFLTSDDGLRVWLVWRWRGSRRELIERDADVVRDALAAHPVFAGAKAVEARAFRAAKAG